MKSWAPAERKNLRAEKWVNKWNPRMTWNQGHVEERQELPSLCAYADHCFSIFLHKYISFKKSGRIKCPTRKSLGSLFARRPIDWFSFHSRFPFCSSRAGRTWLTCWVPSIRVLAFKSISAIFQYGTLTSNLKALWKWRNQNSPEHDSSKSNFCFKSVFPGITQPLPQKNASGNLPPPPPL